MSVRRLTQVQRIYVETFDRWLREPTEEDNLELRVLLRIMRREGTHGRTARHRTAGEAVRLRDAGHTTREIANALGVHYSTVWRWLRDDQAERTERAAA